MGVHDLRQVSRGCDGVFTRITAAQCGVDDRRLRRLLLRREIEQLHHNVLRFTDTVYSPATGIRAAVVAAGRGAVASHSSAAYLLGLDATPKGRPEITIPASSYTAMNGVRIHRTRALPAGDTLDVREVPCTTGSRTLIDFCGRVFYVDALWQREELVVELRGLAFHSARENRLRDEERYNVFTHVGLRPLVFGWREVVQGFDDIAGEIRSALMPRCVTPAGP